MSNRYILIIFYKKIFNRNTIDKKQEIVTLREHMGSTRFVVGSVLLIFFSCLCCVFSYLRTVSYVTNVASFSGLCIIDCPFGFL